MIIYRLSRFVFANDLTGQGAERVGGRWNLRGTAMIYCSENRSLCIAEIAVHTPLGILPKDYCLISIEIPDSIKIKHLGGYNLPDDWDKIPPSVSTQKLGTKFIEEGKDLLLKVPSVVVKGEYNYLINPSHKSISKVKIKQIEPFRFDERLFI